MEVMEEKIWRKFPRELFVNVAAFLPLLSLLKFRTVSQRWNSISRDPQFRELRPSACREFLEEVRHLCESVNGCFSPGDYLCSTGSLFTRLGNKMHVMRPWDLSMKEIILQNCSVINPASCFRVIYVKEEWIFKRQDENTNILCFYCNKTEDLFNDGPQGTAMETIYFKHDSGTHDWSSCGAYVESSIRGFIKHPRGIYLMFINGIMSNCQLRTLDENRHAWSPVRLPEGIPAGQTHNSVIRHFQHKGQTLLLVLLTEESGVLWEYHWGGELGWRLRDTIPITLCFKHYKTSQLQAHVESAPWRCYSPNIFGNFIFF